MLNIVILVWIHFISDFVLQTDRMAQNKSKSFKWLNIHVAVYTAPFILLFGFEFGIVTFISHLITDFFSSRLASHLYQAGHRHWFFVVIGADQALHMTTLLLTYEITSGLYNSGLLEQLNF